MARESHSVLLQDLHCCSRDYSTEVAARVSCLAIWTASGFGRPDPDCQGGSTTFTYYSNCSEDFTIAKDSNSCFPDFQGPRGCLDCCCNYSASRTDFEETLCHSNHWNYYVQTKVGSDYFDYSDYLGCLDHLAAFARLQAGWASDYSHWVHWNYCRHLSLSYSYQNCWNPSREH